MADLGVYDHPVHALRAALGEAISGPAWAEGEQMSQTAALHYAQDLRARLAESGPRFSRTAARRHQPRSRQESGGLTARERDVVSLIVQGKTNRQIANLLVISERTVDKHVGQILAKLGFRGRAPVAAWTVEQGLGKTH